MRASNTKVQSSEAADITAIATRYKVKSVDLLFDIYCLFKSKGQSLEHSPAVLEALKLKHPGRYWVERNNHHRQVVSLQLMESSPLLKAYFELPPLEALDKLCASAASSTLRDVMFKVHGAKVGAPKQDEGNRSWKADSIKADHDSIPDVTFDSMEALIAALFQISTGLNGWAGKCPYMYVHDGNTPTVEGVEALKAAAQFADKGGVLFWQWVKNIGDKSGFEEAKDTVSQSVTNTRKDDTLDELPEVVSANPADIVKPDFEKKVANRSLSVTKSTSTEHEKSHAVVLFDVSQSMAMYDAAERRMSRSAYGMMIVLAMLRKIITRNDVVHLICFEGHPHKMDSAKDHQSAGELIRKLTHRVNQGGSTSIDRALYAAIREIKIIQTYRHADIILISDGEDEVDSAAIRASLPPRTKIRGVKVGESSTSLFRKCCDAYTTDGWDKVNGCPTVGNILRGV